MNTQPVLEMEDVSLNFGGTVALADVNVQVTAGELLALVGPNGSGKTSLCNVVSGLYVPTRGSVRKRGLDLAGLRPHEVARRGVARTFQGIEVFGHMTVFENVLLGRNVLWKTGMMGVLVRSRQERRERHRHAEAAIAAIDLLELGLHMSRVAAELPYGVRKRVELARAMAMEPDLLVLDEPTAGMSRSEKDETMSLIRSLNAEQGLTILMVEHDVRLVRNLASRVVVLNVGRVLADGAPDDVLAQGAVVEAYLGRSQAATEARDDTDTA